LSFRSSIAAIDKHTEEQAIDNRQGQLQNVRNFTVQVRDAVTGLIVGTGIIVTQRGNVLTCAHVVRDAGIHPRTGRSLRNPFVAMMYTIAECLGALKSHTGAGCVSVFFPGPGGEVNLQWNARVSAFVEGADDDIVMLEPLGEYPPLLLRHVAILGDARDSHRHEFCSYGYYRRGERLSGSAAGRIGLTIEIDPSERLKAELVELIPERRFGEGMSGAGVLDCDVDRNVVVGLCSQVYKPDGMAWAVNALLASRPPFNLPLVDSHPLAPPREPAVILDEVAETAVATPGLQLIGAPLLLDEWVGRERLVSVLQETWNNRQSCRALGLIGLAGEGKSSLVRQWLCRLETSTSDNPVGVFWWNCRMQPSIEFLIESMLLFLSGNNTNLARTYTSTSARVDVIGALLRKAPCLFVLDSLESLQVLGGDRHGSLRSVTLRQLLEWLTESGHHSLTIITSRVSVIDLLPMPGYRERSVGRLTSDEGIALLNKLGVKASSPELRRFVERWDGHALTLTLAGNLAAKCGVTTLAADTAAPRQFRDDDSHFLDSILSEYDVHLPDDDVRVLVVCTAFRGEVPMAALEQAVGFDPGKVANCVKTLMMMALLRQGSHDGTLNSHALVRDFYRRRLEIMPRDDFRQIHNRIAEYYQSRLTNDSEVFASVDIWSRVEAIYHLCRAGFWEQAIRLVEPVTVAALHYGEGFHTVLDVFRDFFPNGDLRSEPLLSDPGGLYLVNNELGTVLLAGGRTSKAAHFLRQAVTVCEGQAWKSPASISADNLSTAYAFLGRLDDAKSAAEKALQYATDAGQRCNALCRLANALEQRGYHNEALRQYRSAQMESRMTLMYLNGVQYSQFQIRCGNFKAAEEVVQFNLAFLERVEMPLIATYKRLSADLCAYAGQHDEASRRFNVAIYLARRQMRVDVLLDALLGRGLWGARMYLEAATDYAFVLSQSRRDLEEALHLAEVSDFRLAEIEARAGLTYVYYASKEMETIDKDFALAEGMAKAIGYEFGIRLLSESQYGKMKQMGAVR
jgi:tetratricopeptide (TPR) repeat protein